MAYGAPRRCAAHQYSSQQCELYEVSEIPAAVKVKHIAALLKNVKRMREVV